MKDEADLEKTQYTVGRLMRENPHLRLHENRDELVEKCRGLGCKSSHEGITRCQRKLWELAKEALEIFNVTGDLEKLNYAMQFLPENSEDLAKWCRKRDVDQDMMRRYFSKRDASNQDDKAAVNERKVELGW